MFQAGRRHTRVDTDVSPVRMRWPESKRKHAKSESGGYVNVSFMAALCNRAGHIYFCSAFI